MEMNVGSRQWPESGKMEPEIMADSGACVNKALGREVGA